MARASNVVKYFAYSKDGYNWTGFDPGVFATNTSHGIVMYSANQKLWLANGSGGGNSLAYSIDGFNWTGRGYMIFNNMFGIASTN
jgi:hypothetical protein